MSTEGTPQTLTGRILQLIKEIQLSGEIQGVKLTGKLSDSKGQSLHLLSLVNSVARKLHDSLHHPYYVLIDDLDLHYTGSPSQNTFIAALFTSLRTFNKPPNVKCVVALRDNIYRQLPLQDRDKFHDWVIPIEWKSVDVQRMVEQRVVTKLHVQNQEVWGGVFPRDAFKEIWSHSNGRPREAIRLATLFANEAVKQGHLSVQPDDIQQAIRVFSDERIAEVAAEQQHRYPSLEKVVRRFTGWPKEFNYDRLDALLSHIKLEIEVDEVATREYDWLGQPSRRCR